MKIFTFGILKCTQNIGSAVVAQWTHCAAGTPSTAHLPHPERMPRYSAFTLRGAPVVPRSPSAVLHSSSFFIAIAVSKVQSQHGYNDVIIFRYRHGYRGTST